MLLTLNPMRACPDGRDLVVSGQGKRCLKLVDVLVGEVWILGGQSNMEMPLWLRGDGMVNAEGTRLVMGTDHRWLISCFRVETVDRCHAIAPHIPTAWLCVDAPAGTAADLVRRGHSALHPWVGALTKEVIDECHAHGVRVNTWTCDDPDRMRELISWGIDGICTNVPDVALAVIAAQ